MIKGSKAITHIGVCDPLSFCIVNGLIWADGEQSVDKMFAGFWNQPVSEIRLEAGAEGRT
ncbi:MAG: hypothetical protein CL520_09260 [Actinobacteria bacterium]|nr:hypothetical protein [Actinomycetota bacterium]